MLEALLADPTATALYLYPTKALSRDQEHCARRPHRDAGVGAPAIVFDGDTPGDARRAARERCRIVLTNPDMLHAGILPNHARWARFFQDLRYVVIDELHTYRGVFGSHLANVLRASSASRASTAPSRRSSAPRRPSATRASTPRACSASSPAT